MAIEVTDERAILGYLDSPTKRWNGMTDPGASVVITYSFPEGDALPRVGGLFGNPYGASSYESFSDFQRDMVRSVLDEAAATAGVVFVEVEGEAMLEMYSADGISSVSGYSDYPYSSTNYSLDVDLVMVYQDFTPGTFTYQVLLHELGHALGLEHTHEGDYVLTPEANNQENTVMTYNFRGPYVTTYGELDEVALTQLYGEASATKDWVAGVKDDGTVFVDGSNNGDRMVSTDAGAEMNGMGGDDEMFGRLAADHLTGAGGHDEITGGRGEDTLRGGTGNDMLVGDDGDATAGQDDILLGHRGNDQLYGNGGNDLLSGGLDDDVLYGEEGDDKLRGNDGNDHLYGGNGSDSLIGGDGADIFHFDESVRGDLDVIVDFEQGVDKIDLTALNVDFADLSFKQTSLTTRVYIDGYDNELQLRRTDIGQMDQSDFVFDLFA